MLTKNIRNFRMMNGWIFHETFEDFWKQMFDCRWRDHREADRSKAGGKNGGRRDTYLKIKCKIKHLQKLKWNIFPVKIKHSLDKKFWKFDKNWKRVCKILRKFGFRAVQRVLNLVDLKKCWKMSIWTQKSVLIQRRTSPPKLFKLILFSYSPGI